MKLNTIQLLNFKNHIDSRWEFKNDVNCFIGDNGSGKTNILDAIHYLSLTKSYFNVSDSSSINFNSEYFSIKGDFKKNEISSNIICSVKEGGSKSLKNNDKKYKRLSDHIGKYPVIFISPTDTNLINERSDIRRRYLNSSIAQFNQSYLKKVISYNKTLKQRNRLLKHFYETNTFDNNILSTYNDILVDIGLKIYTERTNYLKRLTPVFQKYYYALSNNREIVNIKYDSQLNDGDFSTLLSKNIEKDRKSKYTSIGIHKDDLLFTLNNYPLQKHGSQGQQKTFVIALKLAQFEFIKQQIEMSPILLLDDIFDKLDIKRVGCLVSFIDKGFFNQVFITDTNKNRIEKILTNTNINYTIFNIKLDR